MPTRTELGNRYAVKELPDSSPEEHFQLRTGGHKGTLRLKPSNLSSPGPAIEEHVQNQNHRQGGTLSNSKQEPLIQWRGRREDTPKLVRRRPSSLSQTGSVPTSRNGFRMEPLQRRTIDAAVDGSKPPSRNALRLEPPQGKTHDAMFDDSKPTPRNSVHLESIPRTMTDAMMNELLVGLASQPREDSIMPGVANDVEIETCPGIQGPLCLNPVRPASHRRSTMSGMVQNPKVRLTRRRRAQSMRHQSANDVKFTTGSDGHEALDPPNVRSPLQPPVPKGHLQQGAPYEKALDERGITGEGLLPTMVRRCIDCGAEFDLADAKYCLSCGGLRVDHQPFCELFETVANCRVTMRKGDLTFFNLKMNDLLQNLKQLKKKSARRQMMDTTKAFNETLACQVEGGCKYTQGITREFFVEFMWRVAKGSELTCRGLLEGLLGRAFVDNDPGMDVHESKGNGLSLLQRINTAKGACPHCGCHLISNSNFCCNCGQEQIWRKIKEPVSFQIFKGTKDSFLGLSKNSDSIGEKEFAELVRLSHSLHVPLDDVRKYWKDFLSLGVNKDNLLPRERFVACVHARCNLPRDAPVPMELLRDEWFKRTPEHGEHVDFEAFLEWSLGTEYVEELIVSDPRERHLRQLARECNLLPNEVDMLKRIFDKYDKNNRGFLEEATFAQAAQQLAREHHNVALGMCSLKTIWADLVFKAGDRIDLETFLNWYTTAFDRRCI